MGRPAVVTGYQEGEIAASSYASTGRLDDGDRRERRDAERAGERLRDLLSPFTASETGADTDVFVPGKSGGRPMHTD